MDGGERSDGTRAVHAGRPAERSQGAPLMPGPQLSAPFHLRGDPEGDPYFYSRYGNPTFTLYEHALGELEGGEVVLFASGMAAISAVLLSTLNPGDRLVMAADCYMSTRTLADGRLRANGVEIDFVATAQMTRERVGAGARILWLETPSNPGLDACDVAALAAPGEDRPKLVVVDNTLPTPLGQRPLDLGADVSVASATKCLSGHSDLIMGYVATGDPERARALRDWRVQTGGVPGPFEAWLAHRSLATLELRLQRGAANALAVAELLHARADVEGVRYPGLISDPAHEIAARQMSRAGNVVAFDLGSRRRAEAFLDAAVLVTEATSFGGVHTMGERRARWGGDAVGEGFVRLSAGIESTRDLVADVEAALDATIAV